MKPATANILNSLVLIILSGYAYLISETPSMTALIPALAGIVLLGISPWFKPGKKVAAHIAVLLTFLIIVALIKPLIGALDRNDNAAILRIIVMMLSSTLAMVVFIRSFVQARMKK